MKGKIFESEGSILKKLSTKHLPVIITAIVLIAATLWVTLSLTMCDYEEPDLPVGATQSSYGNYDYSKKPYGCIIPADEHFTY